MDKCQNCGSPSIKHIQAGISKKTNKPYKAFSVCNDCKQVQNSTPSFQPNHSVQAPPDGQIKLLEDIRDLLIQISDTLSKKGDIPFS